MSWINLLDVIYPVGAVYFSTLSTSPASTIGGTWTQLTGGLLGLADSAGIAVAGSNGGSNTITIEELPPHTHRTNANDVVLNRSTGSLISVAGGATATFAQDYLNTNSVGGGRILFPHIPLFMVGDERLSKVGEC